MPFCPAPQFFGVGTSRLKRVRKLQIRLPSFRQVSMTCEYERSHLCYNMKTFKFISVVKIAKITKGCKIRLSSFKGIKVVRGAKVAKWVAKVAKS